jgi:hypothetical protein
MLKFPTSPECRPRATHRAPSGASLAPTAGIEEASDLACFVRALTDDASCTPQRLPQPTTIHTAPRGSHRQSPATPPLPSYPLRPTRHDRRHRSPRSPLPLSLWRLITYLPANLATVQPNAGSAETTLVDAPECQQLPGSYLGSESRAGGGEKSWPILTGLPSWSHDGESDAAKKLLDHVSKVRGRLRGFRANQPWRRMLLAVKGSARAGSRPERLGLSAHSSDPRPQQ